jgi:hypothetical protein
VGLRLGYRIEWLLPDDCISFESGEWGMRDWLDGGASADECFTTTTTRSAQSDDRPSHCVTAATNRLPTGCQLALTNVTNVLLLSIIVYYYRVKYI